MSDRYSTMTPEELVAEMDAWLTVSSTPKGHGGPSNAAREMANHQFALAETWYYRVKMKASK